MTATAQELRLSRCSSGVNRDNLEGDGKVDMGVGGG